MVEFVVKLQKRRKHICTLHATNKKDAMTSRCLDRKEVRGDTW